MELYGRTRVDQDEIMAARDDQRRDPL
jgi:7-carboxy-7-deazaguanine synthase